MEIVSDADRIKKIISEHGHAAEHNYYHFLNIGHMLGECCFFSEKEEHDAYGVGSPYGVMSYKENNKTYWCYSDPLAPKGKRAEVFLQFVKWAFENGATKVRAEIREELWKEIAGIIKTNFNKKFRVIKPSYIYQWPVYDLKKWDTNLSGAHWKKLRNMRNNFLRENEVNTAGKENASQDELLKLLKNWKAMRSGKDRTHTEHYEAAIKSDFIGYDSVRIIFVNGAVAAINGGWRIAQSNNFYSQLGIPNYDIKNIGDFSYIEDLAFLKNAGYDLADFGGSTPEMMVFKNKFCPSYIYRTVEFSIVEEKQKTLF